MPTSDSIINALLDRDAFPNAAILDSCGVGHLGSHLLIAGLSPVDIVELDDSDPEKNLAALNSLLEGDRAVIFTLSYEFGAAINGVVSSKATREPSVYAAVFDSLLIYDYSADRAEIIGRPFPIPAKAGVATLALHEPTVECDVSKSEHTSAVIDIQERIRSGDTYQTNLTHTLTVSLQGNSEEAIFARLRKIHPAPFAAFIRRPGSTVVSASPERFFRLRDGEISTSPIKGTRRRGADAKDDRRLRDELLASEKDRAENTMIVDLLRNDLGRICEFGSVVVEKLCEIEEHPTLFHLVSTIRGKARANTTPSQIIRSLFPCGSITGAPKISTMRIIDAVERSARGLSMGAIGYYIPQSMSGTLHAIDLSVAIRTMVIRDGIATFRVGGGIVIDSDPEAEWNEAWVKAQALLSAAGAHAPIHI